MAPPAQRVCGFPGCNYGPSWTPYVTEENLPSYKLVIQDMRKHMDIHVALAELKDMMENTPIFGDIMR